MAESDVRMQNENSEEEPRLRYLSFVEAAASQAADVAARLYGKAKEGAGALRPSVEGVEETVKIVAGPVYDKFHGIPLDCLRYFDRKVVESVEEIDRRVPAVVKEAPAIARSAAAQVHQRGLVGAASELARSAAVKAEPVVRNIYDHYEPIAERKAAEVWRSLNRLPVFPAVAQTGVPVVAALSDHYNQVVRDSRERGNSVAAWLPLIPTDSIARIVADPPPPVVEMESIVPSEDGA